MEQAIQQFAVIVTKSNEARPSDELQVLSLEQLEFVAGGDGEGVELPAKGWNTPQ